MPFIVVMDEQDLKVLGEDTSLLSELGPQRIRELLEASKVEHFPKGSTIYRRNGRFEEQLRIIARGAVKVIVPLGSDAQPITDYRGPGDAIGFLSLLGARSSRGDAIALEDTKCYTIDRDAFFELLKTAPQFADRFFAEFIERYLSKPSERRKNIINGGAQRLLFTTPVGELIRRPLVAAPADLSIREAAALMSAARVGALVITDPLGLPTGIVTDRDFRDRAVAKGRDLSQPIANIQSVMLVKADARETCLEALFKLIHYNIRHILVLEGGKPKGMVTDHDIIGIQDITPLSVVREIEHTATLESLSGKWNAVRETANLLLKDGARPINVIAITNELYDRLVRRCLDLCEKRLGQPPSPYCMLLTGAAGRQEQALFHSIGGAILYRDEDKADCSTQEYFRELSLLLSDSVKMAAGNKDSPCLPVSWGSLETWKKRFSDWISACDKKAVISSLPFYDLRPLKEIHPWPESSGMKYMPC